MLENKKMNPVKAIALVYKYEFKNTAKKLVPLYLVLLIFALLTGLLQSPFSEQSRKLIENRTAIEQSGETDAFLIQKMLKNNSTQQNLLVTILTALMVVYGITVIVITILNLSKRFKKSMLKEEAYLNLVLPVSMGQHIWGRYLVGITWVFISLITIILSSFFYVIRNDITIFMADVAKEFATNILKGTLNCSTLEFVAILAVFFVIASSTLILLFYFVNSFAHLFPRKHVFVKILATIGTLYVFVQITSWKNTLFNINSRNFSLLMWTSIGTYAVLGLVFLIFINIIFSKKLNLE